MKLNLFTAGLMTVIFSLSGFAQGRFLTGIIKMADQPVKGLTVYTSFSTCKTDDLGRYALSLNGCASCQPGDKISIFTNHAEYGWSEQTCIISNDLKYNFSIIRNSLYFLVTGIVKNVVGEEGLPGISVKVMGIEFEMEPVRTNSFGEFRIPVRKDILPNKNAVLLQASDSTKRFRPVHSDPELFNINAFAIIKMEARLSYSIQVSGFIRTRVCVKKDDAVSIDASGFIRIGSFTGNSDPDGRSSGVLGLSLEQYNIVQNFNHAALMYRFEGETEWKVAGKKKKFIASRNGCIEFQINDRSQGDNSGAYDVEISVQ